MKHTCNEVLQLSYQASFLGTITISRRRTVSIKWWGPYKVIASVKAETFWHYTQGMAKKVSQVVATGFHGSKRNVRKEASSIFENNKIVSFRSGKLRHNDNKFWRLAFKNCGAQGRGRRWGEWLVHGGQNCGFASYRNIQHHSSQ